MKYEHSRSLTSAFDASASETGDVFIPAWLRLSARLFSTSLDQRLAAGVHPATNPFLAVRSQQIVSADYRRYSAASWRHLLVEAHLPPNPFGLAVPLVRSSVLSAQDHIRSLAEALVSPLVTVRGVAMSNAMLTDGAGPLFNPNSEINLIGAIQEIIAELNPMVSVSSL